MDSTLIAYVAVTLLALVKLADWIAPYHDLSVEGCRITYVYDGDTVELTCPGRTETARLSGFDTPETKSPGCAAEAALGARATERLRALVRGRVTLDGQGREKYGRLLVRITADGRDVGDTLIGEGLAVRYTGGTRVDWCDRLGVE
ncbi:thermonuclease family protein [Actibacterium ureilyticum]|uniref:thermonuclease family protein n=1 Tax=Actibacterium ureilyticum TaxID=1590614 RepID=UPI001595D5A3|nr:thermonuclease family protein [Actibacterium ureilyticum]